MKHRKLKQETPEAAAQWRTGRESGRIALCQSRSLVGWQMCLAWWGSRNPWFLVGRFLYVTFLNFRFRRLIKGLVPVFCVTATTPNSLVLRRKI
jgi:hypothetical protein